MVKNSQNIAPVKSKKKQKQIEIVKVSACRKYHGKHFDKNERVKPSTTPLISIDWIQIWCKIKSPLLVHQKLGTRIANFDPENCPYSTLKYIRKDFNGDPIMSSHVEIWDYTINEHRPILYLGYQPKLNLPHDYTILKVDNSFCYVFRNELYLKINEYLLLLGLEFYKFVRLDIAADFQHFKNRLHPTTFIERHLLNQYVKFYSTSAHIDYKAQKKNKFHYIRFGKKNQPVSWYLYNKSKELREKTDKPYIRNVWTMFTKSQDVWRLEFSLKPSNLIGVIQNENKEITSTLSYDLSLLIQQNFTQLFYDLFYKHCDFRLNKGESRKDRMKKVPLLDIDNKVSNYTIKSFKGQTTSNRMDKIFISMLDKANQSWREQNKDAKLSEFIEVFLKARGLDDWYSQHKLKNVNIEQV